MTIISITITIKLAVYRHTVSRHISAYICIIIDYMFISYIMRVYVYYYCLCY